MVRNLKMWYPTIPLCLSGELSYGLTSPDCIIFHINGNVIQSKFAEPHYKKQDLGKCAAVESSTSFFFSSEKCVSAVPKYTTVHRVDLLSQKTKL